MDDLSNDYMTKLKKKFKFQIWKKNCFPGLSPKPLARVNPKSRRVSNIISDIITVVLKLLKNQITAFNIYGSFTCSFMKTVAFLRSLKWW